MVFYRALIHVKIRGSITSKTASDIMPCVNKAESLIIEAMLG
jgi:hypothetical protein